MNPLHLSGYGIKVKVNRLDSDSELEVTNGRLDERQHETLRFRPRHFPYDSVVIDGHSGYMSLQAFHWLSKHHVLVFMLNYDGELLESMLPPSYLRPDVRIAQYEVYQDSKKRLAIARSIIQGKVAHSLQLLKQFNGKYDLDDEIRKIQHALLRLEATSTVNGLMMLESLIATFYWHALIKIPNKLLSFDGRRTEATPYNARDPVNAALNYGYALLDGECLKAINEVGLEPSVGFLHDRLSNSQNQTVPSLTYDLMEPFREPRLRVEKEILAV